MKVLIFGATRGVGLHVATQALARGHSVSAFARRPEAVPAGARALAGDVLDAAAVAAAVAAAAPDVIVLALGGAGIMARDFVCSQGTANVLAACRGAGIQPRIVACSSQGVDESAPAIPWMVRWLLKHPLADKAVQEAALRASGLPVTIVRPTGLRNDPPRGAAACALLPGGEKLPASAVSREDVAAVMLDFCEPGAETGKTVGLSWR